MFNFLRKTTHVDPNAISWHGPFKTFDDAIEYADDPGYDGDIAIERYIRRYREINADISATIVSTLEKLFPTVAAFGMAEPVDGIYEVVDFGGGYGALYDIFSALFPNRQIRWTIVEVENLVARSSEMGASERKIFIPKIPTSGEFSLIIASGSIQYMPLPRTTLKELASLKSRLFLIARLPIVPSFKRDAIYVQQVPAMLFSARIPVWFFCDQWIAELKHLGALLSQWDSPGDTTVLEGERFCFQSLLIKR
jgi:putative methyltransferase (TIGR04325 family)